MPRKTNKITPFARLLIFLVFLAPLAYIGASYYKGQDGIQNIKNLIGLNKKEVKRDIRKTDQSTANNEEIFDAYKQIEDLKRKLRERDAEISKLKEQLEGQNLGSN